MKTVLLTLLTISLFLPDIKAQYVDLPDEPFRTFLVTKFPGCFNASLQMDTTCTAIISEDSLIFTQSSIGDAVMAIQYFDALTYLDLSNNIRGFSSFPGSRFPSTLLYFKCDYLNQTGSMDPPFPVSLLPPGLQYLNYSNCLTDLSGSIWPSALSYLNISHTQTTGIPTLPAFLDTLICNDLEQIPDPIFNPDIAFPLVTVLPTLPTTLKYLDCSNLGLSSLPALPAGLTWLNCSNNYERLQQDDFPIPLLAVIPPLPSSLTYLNCSYNRLGALPALPNSLLYLDCSNNKYYHQWYYTMTDFLEWSFPGIASLPALPSTLQYLNVAANRLTALGSLPSSLIDLNFSVDSNLFGPRNQITLLPSLPASLAYLNATGNPLSCLPRLPAGMGGQSPFNSDPLNLRIAGTQITCYPNIVPGMRALPGPLCNVANNTNGCDISPIISGNVFYDNNSNGTQDAGELPRANVRVNFSNGLQTFSNINGYYEGTADIGNNTIVVEPPMYYNAVPATFNHLVVAPNTVVTDLVALQPNTSVDSLRITVTALGAPMPGFDFSYLIKYENVGTTVLSADIVIAYDNSKLNYVGSSNASVLNTSTTLTLSPGNLSPGQGGEFTSNFVVNVTTILEDVIIATGTISGGTDITLDSSISEVIGSFDPNDKQATPTLTTAQVSDGVFINYLIRFQNTGTASALNIFITDTLTLLLEGNSFEMIEVSDTCKVTRNGSQLLFQFLNINLPDSNSNEPESHGFIRFRVKPHAALPVSTIIPNDAAIYFDFNAAVLTNVATTTINPTVVPLTLLDFKGTVQPGNNVRLSWQTASEINTAKFDIEQGFNGRTFGPVATLSAYGTGDNSYSRTLPLPGGIVYYRLAMYDHDGRYTHSNIIKISGAKNKAGLVLLSNPVRNKLKIDLLENALVNTIASLINSQGVILKTFSLIPGEQSIDVRNLPAGLYFIWTVRGTERFVISR